MISSNLQQFLHDYIDWTTSPYDETIFKLNLSMEANSVLYSKHYDIPSVHQELQDRLVHDLRDQGVYRMFSRKIATHSGHLALNPAYIDWAYQTLMIAVANEQEDKHDQ